MNRFVKLMLFVMALCLAFALCACGDTAGENNNSTVGSTAGTTETTEATVDDGKVTYTVKVVDEGGNPIKDAMVQLCLETCLPGVTDTQGVATYKVVEADYKVSFVSMPAGYTADATEYHFDAGKYDLTITLKAVA